MSQKNPINQAFPVDVNSKFAGQSWGGVQVLEVRAKTNTSPGTDRIAICTYRGEKRAVPYNRIAYAGRRSTGREAASYLVEAFKTQGRSLDSYATSIPASEHKAHPPTVAAVMPVTKKAPKVLDLFAQKGSLAEMALTQMTFIDRLKTDPLFKQIWNSTPATMPKADINTLTSVLADQVQFSARLRDDDHFREMWTAISSAAKV